MINKEFLDGVKGLVMNCDCKVLILEMFGEVRAFLVNHVNLKTREHPYTEVIGAQDITFLISNVQSNFAEGMTEQKLLERTQSVVKQSFKFGTDNFMWITKVDLNRG